KGSREDGNQSNAGPNPNLGPNRASKSTIVRGALKNVAPQTDALFGRRIVVAILPRRIEHDGLTCRFEHGNGPGRRLGERHHRYETVHEVGIAHSPLQTCMPPMDGPITATTWLMPRCWVTSLCCDVTMSRIRNFGNFMRGCAVEFDGEVVRPFAIASVQMMKYLLVSSALPGPIRKSR